MWLAQINSAMVRSECNEALRMYGFAQLFLHNSKAAGIKHNNNENEWARQLYKWIVAFIIRLKKLPKPGPSCSIFVAYAARQDHGMECP